MTLLPRNPGAARRSLMMNNGFGNSGFTFRGHYVIIMAQQTAINIHLNWGTAVGVFRLTGFCSNASAERVFLFVLNAIAPAAWFTCFDVAQKIHNSTQTLNGRLSINHCLFKMFFFGALHLYIHSYMDILLYITCVIIPSDLQTSHLQTSYLQTVT